MRFRSVLPILVLPRSKWKKQLSCPWRRRCRALKGIEEIRSFADRDMASIVLDVESGEDINELMALVENRIDSIVNLPVNLEKPTVKRVDNLCLGSGHSGLW